MWPPMATTPYFAVKIQVSEAFILSTQYTLLLLKL